MSTAEPPEPSRAPDPAEGPDVAPARPSLGRFLLRLAVSAGLLGVLVAKAPSFDDVLPAEHRARSVGWFLAATAVAMGALVLQGWRWQRVLAVFGDHIGLARLTRHTFAGQFVGNALPTTIGGDVLRVARARTDIGSTERAFASVTLERLTGWVALPMIVAAGFVARPSLLTVDRAWVALMIAGLTLALLSVLTVLAAHPRMAGRLVERANWTRFLGAVHTGVDRMRRHRGRAAAALGAGLAYQCTTVASVYLAMRVVDVHLEVAVVAAIVPAVAMAQVLVPTVNGLGAREGLLVFFLVPLGVSQAAAITIGLTWYASSLLASLPGALDVVLHRPAARSSVG